MFFRSRPTNNRGGVPSIWILAELCLYDFENNDFLGSHPCEFSGSHPIVFSHFVCHLFSLVSSLVFFLFSIFSLLLASIHRRIRLPFELGAYRLREVIVTDLGKKPTKIFNHMEQCRAHAFPLETAPLLHSCHLLWCFVSRRPPFFGSPGTSYASSLLHETW